MLNYVYVNEQTMLNKILKNYIVWTAMKNDIQNDFFFFKQKYYIFVW